MDERALNENRSGRRKQEKLLQETFRSAAGISRAVLLVCAELKGTREQHPPPPSPPLLVYLCAWKQYIYVYNCSVDRSSDNVCGSFEKLSLALVIFPWNCFEYGDESLRIFIMITFRLCQSDYFYFHFQRNDQITAKKRT